MRVFKSRAYKDAERALLATARQVEVDAVVSAARVRLKPGEFGHFLKRVRARREELPPRYTDQPEEENRRYHG